MANGAALTLQYEDSYLIHTCGRFQMVHGVEWFWHGHRVVNCNSVSRSVYICPFDSRSVNHNFWVPRTIRDHRFQIVDKFINGEIAVAVAWKYSIMRCTLHSKYAYFFGTWDFASSKQNKQHSGGDSLRSGIPLCMSCLFLAPADHRGPVGSSNRLLPEYYCFHGSSR